MLVLKRVTQRRDRLHSERLECTAGLGGDLGGARFCNLAMKTGSLCTQRDTVSRATPATLAAAVIGEPLANASTASDWAGEIFTESVTFCDIV